MKTNTVIDLFAGCGGFTTGLKQAGFRVIGAVESNVLAVKVYKANHKEVTVWETDIRKLQPSNILFQLGIKRGYLDLLVGGPPCLGVVEI